MGHIITIDGGVLTGTTANAKYIAKRLNIDRINSGHYFRGCAIIVEDAGIRIDPTRGIAPDDLPRVIDLLRGVEFDYKDGSVYSVNGNLVSPEQLEAAGSRARHIGNIAEIRPDIRRAQHKFAAEHEFVVAEGRDLGTVVFPDAVRKVFLTCNLAVATQRANNDSSRLVTEDEIRERNRLDAERAHSPMMPSPEAIVIDTSALGINQVSGNIINSLRGVPAFQGHIEVYDEWLATSAT